MRFLRVCIALGPLSLMRVALYRLALRLGLLRFRAPEGAVQGELFGPSILPPDTVAASTDWQDSAPYFGWRDVPLGGQPPQWFYNPFSGKSLPDPDRDWTEIPDFDPAVGDIKVIWEASRFDWVVANAHRARQGDQTSLDRLNAWLLDWTEKNPPYHGPNWKCGQEASIRVLHLAAAALLLGQERQPSEALRLMIRTHLRRIRPTLLYAVGQDNNHGTSEAAALFVGGSWLAQQGDREGAAWARTGRRVLAERVLSLVAADGTFSQYSLTYHRVLLDTLVITEAWRRALRLPPFPTHYSKRAAAAVEWLRAFVDPLSGDVPNMGANDGARLLPIGTAEVRDFRPTLQAAAALFCGARALSADPLVDSKAQMLRIELPVQVLPPRVSSLFADGGFAALHGDTLSAFFRFPCFRFRPSQADALHVDLWRLGQGLLRDGGSFGYAADPEASAYFSGTRGHNTITFDGLDQMPKISRFLYADWLKTRDLHFAAQAGDVASVAAGYRSRRGHQHHRKLELAGQRLRVEDEISGFRDAAVLRWRLPPGSWTVAERLAQSGDLSIEIAATVPIDRMEIVEGAESLAYLQRQPCPVLEVEVSAACQVTSLITVHDDQLECP